MRKISTFRFRDFYIPVPGKLAYIKGYLDALLGDITLSASGSYLLSSFTSRKSEQIIRLNSKLREQLSSCFAHETAEAENLVCVHQQLTAPDLQYATEEERIRSQIREQMCRRSLILLTNAFRKGEKAAAEIMQRRAARSELELSYYFHGVNKRIRMDYLAQNATLAAVMDEQTFSSLLAPWQVDGAETAERYVDRTFRGDAQQQPADERKA